MLEKKNDSDCNNLYFSGDNMFDDVGNERPVNYAIFPYKKNLATTSEHIKGMCEFAETYAKRTNTFFCDASEVTAMVIVGLAEHKESLGAPLCPCRHYECKTVEAASSYWNCPCVPMRERKECHCMLFLQLDNEFVSSSQKTEVEDFDLTVDVDTYLWNGDDRVFFP